MKYIKFIVFVILTGAFFSSCVKDLDVTPLDKNTIVSSNLSDNPDALEQTLAKLYASFAIPGQDGVNGASDISGIDAGFGVYSRALWMLQELTTDEALCAWNDQTIKDFHWHTWSPTDVFNNAMYSRIIYSVTICNEFIRNTAGNSDETVQQYNAEARFLRALAYFHAIDMYGNPAFITEEDGIGSFLPKQTTRTELFDFIESELLDIETKLGEPGFMYPRADKAAAWMLLARLYLNAGVYTGTPEWTGCIDYSTKVINSGAYELDSDYQRMFSSDNHTSPEMIFAIAYDGVYTQSYGGTTYIIHAATGNGGEGNGVYPADVGTEGGWGGNRSTKQFINVLVDTLAYPMNIADPLYNSVPDNRVLISLLTNWDIQNVGTFTDGIQIRKFTNLKSDGSQADNYHSDHMSTDFPIFRLADAYLMRAEATLRNSGSVGSALSDINTLREYRFDPADYTALTSIDLDFILDERGRELYWEAVRRTDLIRFGKFTTSDYLWAWKGNTMEGQASGSFRNLFPIPASEIAANPNIKQNDGY
ncbi:MAG: RagB/SusD family nutrient uptake outer membrane protein [Bacteroidales bacterium]|nr:RagB/SusD family nutrient uptake outer membrane protein [Bacteroidales bacterium]